MKKLSQITLLAIALSSVSIAARAADTYNFDPSHTAVNWDISHFGFSYPSGKWMVNQGSLTLDKKNPANSHVNVSILIDGVVTGVPELDNHLKGPMFFDVAKFPEGKFVSDKVEMTSKDTAIVDGKLTIHGITKPVSLNVKLNKEGMNPITNKETLGFTATTHIRRSEFGITSFLPDLGDQVNIHIEAEASKG